MATPEELTFNNRTMVGADGHDVAAHGPCLKPTTLRDPFGNYITAQPGDYIVLDAGDANRFHVEPGAAFEAATTPLPGGGGLPSGYDPARLGANLLWSPNHHQQAVGDDLNTPLWERPAGYGGPGVFVRGAAYVNDPRGHFGVIKRVNNVAGIGLGGGGGPTVQVGKNFNPSPVSGAWWFRILFHFDGNGNANGTGPAAADGGPYSDWWTAFGTLAILPDGSQGSKTYKMGFAWHVPYTEGGQTKANRMSMTMGSGDGFSEVQAGHLESGKIETLLSQGAAPVPPAGSNFNLREVPTLSGVPVGVPHNMRGNRDWYEWVYNYEPIDATSYYQRYFIRRLTVGGAWDPWPYPLWKGWLTTAGLAQPYYLFQVTGNKSQSNDGPNDQFTDIGPVELTNATDPYGWVGYGK